MKILLLIIDFAVFLIKEIYHFIWDCAEDTINWWRYGDWEEEKYFKNDENLKI